jgi:hypothetical protein
MRYVAKTFLVLAWLWIIVLGSVIARGVYLKHVNAKRPPHPCGRVIEPGETCTFEFDIVPDKKDTSGKI